MCKSGRLRVAWVSGQLLGAVGKNSLVCVPALCHCGRAHSGDRAVTTGPSLSSRGGR